MNRNIIKPTIDRIDGWMGYELANLQVITHSENSSKGDRTAIGRRERTMLFFKTLRNKLNLTKYEMARHLDILPQSYYYYEEKARGCSFEILSLIRKKLEISWEEIGQLIDKDVQKGISEKRKNK
jgi:DNA-binding XRE family transcriptional regulator